MKTVVGLFATKAKATQVKDALLGQGFEANAVSVMDQEHENYSASGTQEPEQESIGARIKHFFSGFGEGDHSGHEAYTQGVEQGGAIVSVKASDDQAEQAAQMMHEYGASEVNDTYSATQAGENLSAASNSTNEQMIPIVQEQLEVGKREVNRGGVRVYTHVVETPVTENISLHDERILVERRPVNRAATDADFNAGSGSIELTAMGEEAVVGKRSRVVEEVRLGKVGSEHTETVRDTVRHTEVDLEQLTPETPRKA